MKDISKELNDLEKLVKEWRYNEAIYKIDSLKRNIWNGLVLSLLDIAWEIAVWLKHGWWFSKNALEYKIEEIRQELKNKFWKKQWRQ